MRSRAASRRRPLHFVVVSGPPCAGKSTVARQLSQALGAPHLEMDQIRRRTLPASDQRVEDRDVAYRAMHVAAELMAPWCGTVILDATYSAALCRADLSAAIERTGGALFVIECHVSAPLAVERFRRRGTHPAVDLTPARVAALANRYRHFTEACAVHLNDARRPPSPADVRRYLAGPPLDAAGRARWCRRGTARERPRTSSGRTPHRSEAGMAWKN